MPTSDFFRRFSKFPIANSFPINIDIPAAVTTALGAMPEIRALRPRLVSELPQFDVARFDKLESYILAAGHAHALFLAASVPTESIDELSALAATLRELLLSDATALAKRGFIDEQALKQLKGPNGFRNLAFDLFALAAMMRDHWAAISGKTAVDLTELDKAETTADHLLTAVGLREQGPAVVQAAVEMRQKAFSLFIDAYNQARRAISFLRWDENDVDSIAPSLYAGRTIGRKKGAQPVTPGSHTPPTVPTASPPSPPPAAPSPTAPPATPASPAPPAATSAVGLPGSDPFGR